MKKTKINSTSGKHHPGIGLKGWKLTRHTYAKRKHHSQHFNSRQLAQALKKEQEVNKLKTEHLCVASHDFKNPLAAVIHSADFIERNLDSLDRHKILGQLQKIKSAVSYMATLLNDYLSVEQIESGYLQPSLTTFNLKTFVEEIVAEMKSQTKDWQDIRYTHKGDRQEILLDKNLLRHCLTNLISNAIKYSDGVSHIDIVTEIIDNECTICVKDEGIGIPPEEVTNIFEPFFRASNSTHLEGSGLGLNIVKRYTELMGGKIILHSIQGEGSTFLLKFDPKSLGGNVTKITSTADMDHGLIEICD